MTAPPCVDRKGTTPLGYKNSTFHRVIKVQCIISTFRFSRYLTSLVLTPPPLVHHPRTS